VTLRLDSQPGPAHALRRLGALRAIRLASDVPTSEQVERLRSVGSSILVGTPTLPRRIARALDTGENPAPTLRLVFSQGEPLDRGTRELLVRTLGRDPFEL
jgi:phenylacetate-coenzyme A ligase PaaK-like adenylate-forming protein